jgi:hypothetical protein
MKKLFVFFTAIILLASCAKNESPIAGKHFSGYWKHISYLSLHFENDSIVSAVETGAEFVGSFTDKAKGHYAWQDSTIVVYLIEGNSDNISLTNYPIVDTFVANSDFSVLTGYQGSIDEKDGYAYKLKRYTPWLFSKIALSLIVLISFILLAKKNIEKEKGKTGRLPCQRHDTRRRRS